MMQQVLESVCWMSTQHDVIIHCKEILEKKSGDLHNSRFFATCDLLFPSKKHLSRSAQRNKTKKIPQELASQTRTSRPHIRSATERKTITGDYMAYMATIRSKTP